MSILNVFITPNLGLVGVDTEAIPKNGPIFEIGKLVVAPLANSVVGFRGTDYVLAVMTAHIVGFGGTHEQMVENFPDVIKQSVDCCRKSFDASEEALKLDIALVGYSQKEGCISGYLFTREVGSDEINVNRIRTSYMSPLWSEEDIPVGIHLDRKGMVATAQQQSRLARERAPEFASGGRFYIAELRKDSMTIEKAFEFPKRNSDS